jgi:hypothetical protein
MGTLICFFSKAHITIVFCVLADVSLSMKSYKDQLSQVLGGGEIALQESMPSISWHVILWIPSNSRILIGLDLLFPTSHGTLNPVLLILNL